MRVGMGYDVHKLVEERELILGGVNIPHTLGLLGHSDADVLLHAIMDALLGAAALGDIGKHFPDTDEKYKGISSLKLLEHVGKLIEQEGYVIENIASIYRRNGREYCKDIAYRKKTDQCQSNDRRTAWFYRKGRGHCGTGNLLFKQYL